jgi:serine protease Do
MKTYLARLLAALLALSFLLAACGGDDGGGEEADEDRSEEENEDEDTEDTTTTTEPEDDRGEAIGDFTSEVEDELGEIPDEVTSYGEYVRVSDDSGFLSVEVPAAWSDVNGEPGLFGPDVIASTDVQAFIETYDVSGVEFQATDLTQGGNPDATLDAVSQVQAQQCTALPRQDYADPLYTGRSQVFEDCAGSTTDFVWVAMEPADLSFHGVVGIQITNEADLEALERILDTFVVNV